MQIGELVNAFETSMEEDKCTVAKEYSKQGWEARVNQWGTKKQCSGTHLYKKMKQDKDKDQGFLSGPIPYVAKQKTTTISQCGHDRFPIQAHHLIPKNYLPDHEICAFLAKNYGGEKEYELHEDAPYSCDHANNGYCMPYATPLAEWKKAGKDDNARLTICKLVMEATRRQLHQGSHRAEPYEGAEDDEEPNIHKKVPGYLEFVGRLLSAVYNAALAHPDLCKKCKADAKKKIPPRQNTVRYMDQASGIIKLVVDAKQIFVSKPAFQLWGRKPKVIKCPDWLK